MKTIKRNGAMPRDAKFICWSKQKKDFWFYVTYKSHKNYEFMKSSASPDYKWYKIIDKPKKSELIKQQAEKIENQAAELKKANIRNNNQRIELKRLNAYRVDNQQQTQDQAKEIEGKSIYIKNLKAAFKDKCHKVMRERDEFKAKVNEFQKLKASFSENGFISWDEMHDIHNNSFYKQKIKNQAKKIKELELWIDDQDQEISDIRKTVPPLKNEIKELKSEVQKLNMRLWRCSSSNILSEAEINKDKETIEALTRENTRLEQLVTLKGEYGYTCLDTDREIAQEKRINQLEKERAELIEQNNQLQSSYEALTKVIEAAGYNHDKQDLDFLERNRGLNNRGDGSKVNDEIKNLKSKVSVLQMENDAFRKARQKFNDYLAAIK